MSSPALPTDIIVARTQRFLSRVLLEGAPQPGAYLDLTGKSYLILERRHRYRLVGGSYQLSQVILYVQAAPVPREKTLVDGHWVIGNTHCRYNAQSEVLRCAVNPEGPCDGCAYYEGEGGSYPC